MNPEAEIFVRGLLWSLAKGLLWLGCCGLLHWKLARWAPSWRVCLLALLAINFSNFLPATWSWVLNSPLVGHS